MCLSIVANVALVTSIFLHHFLTIFASPARFQQDFKVIWSNSHLKLFEGGRAIQLILDRKSGSGFASKHKYMYGRFCIEIKLIMGDSAGTVTAFYMNSDTGNKRDELDFEFLGNRSGKPYTVQTNIYIHGKGNREQRLNLWFDPSLDYHTYCILWNHRQVMFSVDEVPIRIYTNNEAKGILYPKSQAMGVISTLWEADNWATRGGLDKIDWRKAPFIAYYKDFDIQGCAMPRARTCASNLSNWWEGTTYQGLSPTQAQKYHWVRANYIIYDYCTDKSRYPIPPLECRIEY